MTYHLQRKSQQRQKTPGSAVALLIVRDLWNYLSLSLDSHQASSCTEETRTTRFSSRISSSCCSYQFRALYNLLLLKNPPVAELDMVIMSFLSLGLMVGRDSELGMPCWGELSRTVKSEGQQRHYPTTFTPGLNISCCKLTLRERRCPALHYRCSTLILKFLHRKNERFLYINTWCRHTRRSKNFYSIYIYTNNRNNTHFQAWWQRVFTALMDDCSAAWKRRNSLKYYNNMGKKQVEKNSFVEEYYHSRKISRVIKKESHEIIPWNRSTVLLYIECYVLET